MAEIARVKGSGISKVDKENRIYLLDKERYKVHGRGVGKGKRSNFVLKQTVPE